MAFVKDDSEASARLVEKIDRLVQENKDQGLKGFVVYVAGPEVKGRLEKIAAERNISIPLTYLPKGTDDSALRKYRVNLSVANTVIVYKRKKAVYTATNVGADEFAPVAEAAKTMLKSE